MWVAYFLKKFKESASIYLMVFILSNRFDDKNERGLFTAEKLMVALTVLHVRFVDLVNN